MQSLVRYNFSEFNDAADLRGSPSEFARGSMNLMPQGRSGYRPFRNNAAEGVGSRLMFQVSDTYGGLDDQGGNEAKGSLFTSLADALLYIGHGQVSVEGVNLAGLIATELLQITLKYNGSYTDPLSYTYIVGLSQPVIGAVSAVSTSVPFTPITNGEYSFKIARIRESTGGKSKASATSAVLTLTAQGVALVLPAAQTGQTHWAIFVTDKGLGGVGLHYRIARANPYTGLEYTESDVQRSISTLSVTNGSNVVTSSVATFTSADTGKRFNPVSAGFSVPAGTTVTYNSSTQITLSNNVTVSSGSNPRTAELIAYAGGVDRSVLLNWKESDLNEAAELDWIYDYPPPSGSHAFQLETRIVVASRADSSLEASAENAGTAFVFSLPNQMESFDLRFPLYLPEPVVDVIGRGIDSYSFIGTRNGIYAMQFINSDLIPATVSVILASEGISHRKNWAISSRGLYICVGKGSLVKVGEGGQVDTNWFDPIRRYIQNWEQIDTVVIADPKNKGVIAANGDEAFFYDEQTGRWSTILDMRDTATGTIIAGIGARSQAYFSMEYGSTRTGYSFDNDTGSYIVGIAPYAAADRNNSFVAQRMMIRYENDRNDGRAFVMMHKNNQVNAVTDGAITIGTNTFTSNAARFTAQHVGNYLLIKGAGTGLNDNGWMIARIIQVVDAQTVKLGTITEDLSDAVPLNAPATVSSAYTLICCRLYAWADYYLGTSQKRTPEFFHNGLHSVAASMLLFTAGDNAQPIEIEVVGLNLEEKWEYIEDFLYIPLGVEFEEDGIMVEKLWFPAAGVYNGIVAPHFWDLGTANYPTPTEIIGSNIRKGVLRFSDGATQSIETHLILPDDWTGAIDIRLLWTTPATSGNVKWQIQTSFSGVGGTSTDDNAYNTAQSIIQAAAGVASAVKEAILTGLTNTGSSPSSLMHIKLTRNPADAADTIGNYADFVGAEFTIRRTA